MSQERKSFTVSDRRHFTSEGEPRHEEGESSPPPESATPEAPEPQPPPPAAETQPPDEPAFPHGAEVPDTADFASFLVSLAAQAGAALQAEKAEEALPAARYLISVLEMLEDKSRGRRTPEEDEILTTLLYELRMAYVGRTRAGGA
jgi:hypothetical protein